MATRRMLSKTISYSEQVNSLSEFAQLLFTWIIPYLDDFGKIEGEATKIKAMVMPLSSRSVAEVEAALKEMLQVGLIQRYSYEDRLTIYYSNFDRYQTNLHKRTKSRFPNPDGTYPEEFPEIPGNSRSTQDNETYIEHNKTEEKEKPIDGHTSDHNPNKFRPINMSEEAALNAWRKFDHNAPWTFYSTYLKAVRQGLTAEQITGIVNRIETMPGIEKPGAMFSKLVKETLNQK